jgi:hypothetical protein
MDLLFNLNEGNYAVASGPMAVEVLISAYLLVGAPLLIAYLWRRREMLLQSRP